ncbi:MAG: glycosyl hydrolase family protein [Chloroflexi bacterium]|nr:MAG: glycosyl hydrolase family protein [Chloroflexota bacterium]
MSAGRFPEGFFWGTAAAAHQVEGGNHANDWWAWEQTPGHIKNGDRSDPGCDHYQEPASERAQTISRMEPDRAGTRSVFKHGPGALRRCASGVARSRHGADGDAAPFHESDLDRRRGRLGGAGNRPAIRQLRRTRHERAWPAGPVLGDRQRANRDRLPGLCSRRVASGKTGPGRRRPRPGDAAAWPLAGLRAHQAAPPRTSARVRPSPEGL